MSTLPFFILIGIVFGFLAALIAFGITWIEWQKHRFAGWRLWREALQAGAFAFIFFLILSVLIGYFLIDSIK